MHEDNFCAMVSVWQDAAAKIRPYFYYRISMFAVVGRKILLTLESITFLNTYKCQGFPFSTCSTFRLSFLLFFRSVAAGRVIVCLKILARKRNNIFCFDSLFLFSFAMRSSLSQTMCVARRTRQVSKFMSKNRT